MLVDMNCHSLDGRLLGLSCARLPIKPAAPERIYAVVGMQNLSASGKRERWAAKISEFIG
jgi:hypothetical protein